MFPRISNHSERIIAILSKYRKPNQIAWGIAIGITLGLIPKDNLIVLSLVVVLACMRVNQLAACCTAVSLSLLGDSFRPLTNYVGSLLLEQPGIINGIVYLYRIPMLPWTCLENTRVLGGIGVGLTAILPAYAICQWSIFKARQKLQSIELEQVANHAIQYRKSVADQSRSRQEKLAPSLNLISVDTLVAENSKANSRILPTVAPSNPLVPSYIDSSSKVLQVNSESVASKQPDSESLQWMNRSRRQKKIPMIFTDEAIPDGNDTFLRETVIEVVRYRRPVSSSRESKINNSDSAASPHSQGISMPVGNASNSDSKEIANLATPTSSKTGTVGQSIVFDTSHSPSHASSRDESLKYLLWHINGSRESVRKQSEKTA